MQDLYNPLSHNNFLLKAIFLDNIRMSMIVKYAYINYLFSIVFVFHICMQIALWKYINLRVFHHILYQYSTCAS